MAEGELSMVDQAARTAVLALRRMRATLDDVDAALKALAEASGDGEAPELFREVASSMGVSVLNAVDAVTLILGRESLALLLAGDMAPADPEVEEAARGPRDVRDRVRRADSSG